MSASTRNRVLGIILLLAGLAGLWVPWKFSGTTAIIVSLLAGAGLGAGSALVVTGKPFWTPETWWATWHPLRQDWF